MKTKHLIGKRYLIQNITQDRIGRGGMGYVYRALDTTTGRIVAVKQLRTEALTVDAQIVQRFQREGEALRRLNHPNIVAMLDSIQENEQHYLVMEYVAGGSLQELLERDKQLPISQVLKIGLELADALTRAHHLNIIHRDIKPANILLAEDLTPRLTDFGIAQIGGMGRITQDGALTGTYSYLSPEACEGQELDTRTDIWSFGVLLYQMVSGRLPFEETTLTSTLTSILTKPAPDLSRFSPSCPTALLNLLDRMLVKNRDKRMTSARQVGAQLEAIIAGTQIEADFQSSRFETTPTPVQLPSLGPRHNLPAQTTPFIGRQEEIADIRQLLQDPACRLVTLLGPGGMGKTRLSIEVGLQSVSEFTHGVRFVPLAPVQSAALVAIATANALKLTITNNMTAEELLFQYLREKEMLLIFDNFEHVVEGAELLSLILQNAPQVKMVVTSRETLNLWEEWTRPLHGLSYPTTLQPEQAEGYSAIKLFLERARRVRGTVPPPSDLPSINAICRLVDGMPLGIELAATWLKTLTPAQIVAEIEKNFDFLATTMRNLPERHRSIRAVFEYSWQLLTAEEQQIFARLSVFRGGFEGATAVAVAEASLPFLASLVNKSLVEEHSGRYSLHELLRQFAAEKLGEETAVTQARHAHYYLHWVTELEKPLKQYQQNPSLLSMRREVDNIRTAWQWACQNLLQVPELALLLGQGVESLSMFCLNEGYLQEGLQAFELARHAIEQLGLADADMLWAQGRVTIRAGIFYYRLHTLVRLNPILSQGVAQIRQQIASYLPHEVPSRLKYELSFGLIYHSHHTHLQDGYTAGRMEMLEAIQLAEEHGDPWLLLRVYNAMSLQNPNYDEVTVYLHKAYLIGKETGDLLGLGYVLYNLSLHERDLAARARYREESAKIFEQLGNPVSMALAYLQMGYNLADNGRYPAAQTYIEKAFHIYHDLGFVHQQIGVKWTLSQIVWAIGDWQAAHQHLREARVLAEREGSLDFVVRLVVTQAHFYLHADEYHQAKECFKQMLALLPQITAVHPRIEALDALINLALMWGDYAEAQKLTDEYLTYAQTSQNPANMGWAYRHLGIIAFELGDYSLAEERWQKSLTTFLPTGNPWALALVYKNFGQLAYSRHQLMEAQSYYHQALQTLPKQLLPHTFEILVEWAQLTMHQNQPHRALECLSTLHALPRFAGVDIPKPLKDKARKLMAELAQMLPPEDVLDIQVRTQTQKYETFLHAWLEGVLVTVE